MAINYLMTVPGIIKCVEEVLNFIAFMCVACHSWTSEKGDAFLAASIGAFIITAILLVIYVMDVQTKISLPWIKIQFFYCVIWGLFYLIVSALVIDVGAGGVSDSYVAGGVFGLFATTAYFVDAFFKYRTEE